MKLPRIAITLGEPAGIGPDLILQLANCEFAAELVVIADPELLAERNKKELNNSLETSGSYFVPSLNLSVLPVHLNTRCVPGQLDPANSAYVIETLRVAAQGCLDKQFDAVVTGPVHKGIINQAGIPFRGHTEFFAEFTKTEHVVMMFAAKDLRLALATTHLPLRAVADALTMEGLIKTLTTFQQGLQNYFGIANPRILVAGLNPHAGENGYLGREEIEVIIPALNQLRAQGMHLIGPLPADTLFLPKNLTQADAVLTMYHDQGLPVLKHIGFDHAVNITLGLPFIRTSVDHGTALELAGTGKADASNLKAAIEMAIKIVQLKEF